MNKTTLFFFDFDGVICDSIDECLLSSWLAYYKFFIKKEPPAMPLSFRSRFASLRPFIRDGQDYLLIHQLQQADIQIQSQQEFDNRISRTGATRMQTYRELFYTARDFLLKEDIAFWCRLNRLYPHMQQVLPVYLAYPTFYILSTKKPEYILKILKYNHLQIPAARVLYPGKESKCEIIKTVMQKTGKSRAVFVDDQIDHLYKVKDPSIKTYLPSWGYIKSEWLTRGIPILRPEAVSSLFTLQPEAR